MFTRQFVASIAIACLALSLTACESYPLLDGTIGFATGGGDGSGSGGGGTGGGATNSNTNGAGTDNGNSNLNDNGSATDVPTSPTADVSQAVCDNFIAVLERDGSRALNVYEVLSGGNFADWAPGNDVGFAAGSGTLVNLTIEATVTARIIGEYGGNTLFLSRNEIVQTVTLQNGDVWAYGPDDAEEARQWQANADLITVVDVDENSAVIINRTRCTSIVGASQ